MTEFENTLNFDELEILITSVLPNERATTLACKLNHKIIINKEQLYIFNKTDKLYAKTKKDLEKSLYHISTLLVEVSYKKLSSIERELLATKYKNEYSKIYSNGFIKLFYPQLTIYLTNDEINFHDPQLMEIHF